MTKKFLIIFLSLFFISPIFAFDSAATQLTVLLNQFKTLQANFSQITTNDKQQTLQKSEGVMLLMKPNHFRFETKKPTHQIVITDGNTLWIYDVDLAQATQQTIEKMPINPAKILAGKINALLKQFNVFLLHRGNLAVFQLTPKKPNPAFSSVTVSFLDKKLHDMQIQMKGDQKSIFTFSKVTLNPALSQQLFRFVAPKGVDILR